MVEHVQRNWGKYFFGLFCVFFSTIVSLNFNTIAYLITRDPNLIRDSSASQSQTILRFSPTAGQFQVGDTFNTTVLLDAPQSAINTEAGEILFPVDKLSVESISTDGSINTLWVPTDPFFSTTTNSIIFAGGLPTPGFEARNGKILTISFRVKAAGSAQVRFINAKVLADDGAGTELAVTTWPMNLILKNPISQSSGIAYRLGDLNRDGLINITDESILIANWGVPKPQDGDLNGDGLVGAPDLSILLSKMAFSL